MPDFAKIFAPAALKTLGLPQHTELDPELGVYRAPYLKWSDIKKSYAEQKDIAFWQICCDVLEVDAPIYLNADAFVFARRIELGPRAELSLDMSEAPKLMFSLTAQEMVDAATGKPATLETTLGYSDENDDLQESSFTLSLTTHELADGQTLPRTQGLYLDGPTRSLHRLSPANTSVDFLSTVDLLPKHLRTTFQLACLMFTDDPDLAIKQTEWIAAITQAEAKLKALNADAHGLHETILALQSAKSGVLLVPQLDFDIYAQTATACAQVLRDRQARYDAIQQNRENTDLWLSSIKTAIADKDNDADLAQGLHKQAERTARQAAEARTIAAGQVAKEDLNVALAREDFVTGIRKWRDEQIRKEAMNIVESVFDLATQVPAIVASGGALAALPVAQMAGDGLRTAVEMNFKLITLASSAKDAIKNRKKTQPVKADDDDDDLDVGWLFSDDDVETYFDKREFEFVSDSPEATKFAEDLQAKRKLEKAEKKQHDAKISKVKEGGKALASAGGDAVKIGQGIINIVNMVERARRMEEQSETTLLKASATVDGAFGSIEPMGLDVVTGGAEQWDLLGIELDSYFAKIPDEIGGKDEYRQAMSRLLVKGKVMSDARLALAAANAELINTTLRLRAAEEARRIYDRQLDEIEAKDARAAAMEQLAFDRVLDSKRSVFLAMEAYSRAHAYFILDPAPSRKLLPRITDSVDAFNAAVSRVASLQLTLDALSDAPTDMNRPITIVPGEDGAVVAEDGTIVWTLPQSPERFRDFYRVRVERIRAYVDADIDTAEFTVEIRNSGHYDDRMRNGRTMTFMSKPYAVRFRYAVGREDTPIGDGKVVARFQDDFFLPTPFTQWTLRVLDRDGTSVPANLLKSIELQMSGQWTAMP